MRGLNDQHSAGQGLYHTTATSLLQEDGPLPPGQNGLKLPLGPGLLPPHHLDWAQHDRAAHSAQLGDDVSTQGEGPLPAARRSDWAFSIQVRAAAVCPSPPRLPHIMGYVGNTAPVL